MSDSNTNSSTPDTTISGLDSPNFNDLFNALEKHVEMPDPKIETKEDVAEDSQAKAKPEEKTTITAKGEDNKVESKEKSEEKQDLKDAKDDTDKTDAEESEKTAKTFKFKVGPKGKEVELPEDAKITIPVDGKDVEFTLAEMKAEINGKTVWSKKFTDLDKERTAFDTDRKKTEATLNRILDKVYDEQDAAGAILEMCQVANLDPAPVFQAFQKSVIGDLDKFLEMTDLERENYLLKQERDFLAQNRKASEAKEQKEHAAKALEEKAQKMREGLDVSDEWMEKAEKQIAKAPEAFKSWLNGKEATKEHIVYLADLMERWELAEVILKKVDPELAKDEAAVQLAVEKLNGNKRVPLTEAVAYAAKLFGRTPADQKKADSEKAAKAAEEALAKKIKQNADASDEEAEGDSKRKVKSRRPEPVESLNWDDL